MRNERFFTYVEKHPVARFIAGPGATIMNIYGWFTLAVALLEFTGDMQIIGIIYSLVIFGVSKLLTTYINKSFSNIYKGEIVTDYFNFSYSYIAESEEVNINGVKKECTYICNDKECNPIEMPIWSKIKKVYKLNDDKGLYMDLHGKIDTMAISLNDTIIMENDHIYYDRIDKIYGATNKPFGSASSQIPINESIGRTAPIAGLQSGNSYTLTALEGQFAGKNWNFDKAVMLGRASNCCQIIFSADTAGVSRVHCEVGYKEGSLYIRDRGSSYGTILENGSIVNNYHEVKVENNTVFRLNNNEKFMITKR